MAKAKRQPTHQPDSTRIERNEHGDPGGRPAARRSWIDCGDIRHLSARWAFDVRCGLVYHFRGDRPLAGAALKGVAAAAVGLILATCVELAKKSLANNYDLIFIELTVIGVNRLHQSVPRVLITVGALATLWYRPRARTKEGSGP